MAMVPIEFPVRAVQAILVRPGRDPASPGNRDISRRLAARAGAVYLAGQGQVAEWLKAHAWKVCNGESRSRVRIPLCPPIKRPPEGGFFIGGSEGGGRTRVRRLAFVGER